MLDRLTLTDEHPCQFCDFSCTCKYWGLSESQKKKKCRVYLYFLKLQKLENIEDYKIKSTILTNYEDICNKKGVK